MQPLAPKVTNQRTGRDLVRVRLRTGASGVLDVDARRGDSGVQFRLAAHAQGGEDPAHNLLDRLDGGAATMREGPIAAYRDAAARAGIDLKLGENLMLGIFFHLADTKEKAIAEMKPLYEEHAKMFAPLGFVPGVNAAQVEAIGRRGGW